MRPQPLVSIITTCRNAEATLERTIRSVLQQTYPHIEYIIYDADSSDGTLGIIKKYEDQLAHWKSESDEGISDGWNKALRQITGDIVGIINADDWYEPDAVALAVDAIVSAEADGVVGSITYHAGTMAPLFTVLPDPNFAHKLSFRMPRFNHPASFFKKAVYDHVGDYNIQARYAMDYDFVLRVVAHDFILHVTPEVLVHMEQGGVSDHDAPKAYREVLRMAPNKSRAYAWFLFSVFKYYVRRVLLALGMGKMIRAIQHKKYHTD